MCRCRQPAAASSPPRRGASGAISISSSPPGGRAWLAGLSCANLSVARSYRVWSIVSETRERFVDCNEEPYEAAPWSRAANSESRNAVGRTLFRVNRRTARSPTRSTVDKDPNMNDAKSERKWDPPLSTGIAGLDNILCGGLDADRIYLVEGEPGTGKTTL